MADRARPRSRQLRRACQSREHRAMTVRDRKSAFALSPGDPEAWIRKADDRAVDSAVKTQRFTASLTSDVPPELRSLIKVTAVQRGLMVAETPRNLCAREFPQRQGGRFDGRSHRG